VTDALTCAIVDEQDLVTKYVAGELTEAEEQQLEAHCLRCEQCWEDLRLALKVRAATMTQAPVSARPAQAGPALAVQSRSVWWAAAAAVLVVCLGGGWWLRQRAPVENVERSAPPLERVQARSRQGSLVVSWPDVSGATRYAVTVAASDGHSIARSEVSEGHAEFHVPEGLPPGTVVTVEAFSPLGDHLASSPPTPVH